MKQTFLFIALILATVAFGQKDKPDTNISVISVEKANILYRGINNSIKIAVSGAKSFTATGPGVLIKRDSIGNYHYNVNGVPGKRTKITIDAVMPDNTIKHEEKEFEIRELKKARVSIKDQCCSNCIIEVTKHELEIFPLELEIDDLALTIKSPDIKSFQITLPNKKKISVKGNKFDSQSLADINKLKIGSTIYINEVEYSFLGSEGMLLRPLEVLKLMLVDKH